MSSNTQLINNSDIVKAVEYYEDIEPETYKRLKEAFKPSFNVVYGVGK